jgi:hypothetical protein
VELVVVRANWPGHPRKKKKILAPRIQFPKSNFSALMFSQKNILVPMLESLCSQIPAC